MSDKPKIVQRLLAIVHALLPGDWFGEAGETLRETGRVISDFAEQHHIRAKDIPDEAVELTRSALHGKATKDLAAATKDFQEAEKIKIDTKLARRSAAIDIEMKHVDVELKKMQVLHSRVDLIKKMQGLNVTMSIDEHGNFDVLQAPKTLQLGILPQRFLQSSGLHVIEVLETLVSELNTDLAHQHITITVTEECKHWLVSRTRSDSQDHTLWEVFRVCIKQPLFEKLPSITTRPAFIEVYLESDGLFYRAVGEGMENTRGELLFDLSAAP
jgi:hypothetical protein